MHPPHSLRKLDLSLYDFGVFEVCLLFVYATSSPNNIAVRLNQGFVDKMQCCWGNKLPDPFDSCNTRYIFLANFSTWLPQVKFASVSTPRDFDVYTLFTGVPLMLRTGEAVRVFSFCHEPISINSVLVILSVSLLAISHLLIFSKSSFKQDWMILTPLSA